MIMRDVNRFLTMKRVCNIYKGAEAPLILYSFINFSAIMFGGIGVGTLFMIGGID